jgi:site-specific DNA recombinase
MRAAIYARVSTARQEQEDTIDSQIAAIKQRIKDDGHEEPAEANIYTDEGYTGSILERPALDLLRQDAKDGAFDILYIFDYGRISRDLVNLLIVKDDITQSGVEIASLFERITGEPMIDTLMLQILGAIHEYERKKIVQRFLNGKLQKARSGRLVGYNPPYGYDYHPKVKNKDGTSKEGYLTINDFEADVVRMIFNWVGNERISLREVRKRLYEQGIPPRKEKQASWTTGPLRRLLSNETYIKKHYFNKFEAIEVKNPRKLKAENYRKIAKASRRLRPKDQWIPIDAKHIPRIINDDLFEKVQEQMEKNTRYSSRHNTVNSYLLTGLIECPCGLNRVGEGVNGKIYYRCSDRIKRFPMPRQCLEGGLSVPVVDELVWQNFFQTINDDELIIKHAETWLDAKNNTPTESNNLLRRKDQLKGQLNRYTKIYGQGLMTEELFAQEHNRIQDESKQIDKRLEKVAISSKISMDIQELVSEVKKLLLEVTTDDRKTILRKFVDKIVATQKEVKVYGYFPLTLNRKVNLNAIYSNTQISLSTNKNRGSSDGKVILNAINRHSWFAQCRQVHPI